MCRFCRLYEFEARVRRSGILLDRGWGRAPQPHTGEDDKDIRITVRNLIEEKREG